MTSKLTREELLNIIETDHVQCGEASALASMALAAMDSEPVQMFGIGSIFKPQQVIEQEADCDDCAHYNPKICHGEGCPAISQQSAQPAPVVPDDVLDALQKVARIRLDMNDFDGDRRGIADCLGDAEEALIEVVNRRAAMLQEGQKSAGVSNNCRSNENVQVMQDVSRCSTKSAPALDSPPKTAEARCGNSPVIPDGYVMVPKIPGQAHLNSIAMRYRHDFYLLNDAQKDNALAVARQMYEECSGQGFYTLPAAPQEVPDGQR